VKRINIYLLILAILCCASFIPLEKYPHLSFLTGLIYGNVYAGEEDTSLSLPLGVKSADEKSVESKPIQDESSMTPQKAGVTPAQTLENTQESGTPESAPSGIKKDTKESLPRLIPKDSKVQFRDEDKAQKLKRKTTNFKTGIERGLSQKGSLAELRAYVDKSAITIGEKITYTLEIDADNNLKVEFPSYVSGLGGFAVKDFGKDDKKIGRHRSRKTQWYLLDTYTTGSYVIPEQQVTVKLPDGKTETLRSPRIFVEVKSVIDNEKKEGGLRDIKAPLAVKIGIPVVLIIAAILIILTAGGIIFWKVYLKRFSAKKMEPALTPREIAFRELERIESLGLIEKKRIKEYYYLVSFALRTYLENRFFLKAPEQTTEEFLESVVRSDKLEGRYINILKEYLNHCDLVKYAKFDPGKSEAISLIETTRRFIEETVRDKEEFGDDAIKGTGI